MLPENKNFIETTIKVIIIIFVTFTIGNVAYGQLTYTGESEGRVTIYDAVQIENGAMVRFGNDYSTTAPYIGNQEIWFNKGDCAFVKTYIENGNTQYIHFIEHSDCYVPNLLPLLGTIIPILFVIGVVLYFLREEKPNEHKKSHNN